MGADAAGSGEQTDLTASTPSPDKGTDKQETTAATSPEVATETDKDTAELHGIMDHLDLPPGVRDQLISKKKKEEPPQQAEQKPEPTPEPEATEAETEAEDDDDDEEETKPAAEDGKLDKRDKRIKRLTRQKKEIERELTQARELLAKGKPEGSLAEPEPQEHYPTSLVQIQNEKDLDREVARAETEADKADAIIDFCDANANGTTTTDETGETKFITGEQIAGWKRKAEKTKRDQDKIVLKAERRRQEIRKYEAEKGQFDGLARTAWPQLFDNTTKEYQLAQAILDQFPTIRGHPQANYAVGLVLEGMKAVQIRAAGNGAPVKPHRDIDERAFAPRVPIAPSNTPNPPSRDVEGGSSHKKFNEAMDKLVKDPDGSASSLAAVMAAMDEAPQRAGSRTRVRV